MNQAEGEGELVFIHYHIETISGDVREFLKTIFAAVESEEWCVGYS